MKICSNTKCGHVEKDTKALYCGKCGSEFVEDADIISGNIIETQWGEGGVGTIMDVDVGISLGLSKGDVGRIVGSDNRTIAKVRISNVFKDNSTIFVTEVIDAPRIIDRFTVQFVTNRKEQEQEQVPPVEDTKSHEPVKPPQKGTLREAGFFQKILKMKQIKISLYFSV